MAGTIRWIPNLTTSGTIKAAKIIGGETSNSANGILAFVGGGDSNQASGDYSVVCGGSGCVAAAGTAPVVGNTLIAGLSTVGGGFTNMTNADYATISGGRSNYINTNAHYASIGGGQQNAASTSAIYATVGGGSGNAAGGEYSTVAGGQGGQATGKLSSVIGGDACKATGEGSVSGGTSCTAGGASAVSLGNLNNASASYSAVIGGSNNKVWPGADNSVIVGGINNNINSNNYNSIILGGTGISGVQINTAYTPRLTTRGGRQKRVDMYTTNVTLGLDQHVVGLNNTSASIPLVATLPTSPVDGQEYYIKCLSEPTTPAKASVTVYTGVGGKAILSPNGVGYLTTPPLPRGSTLHLIYVASDGSWAEVGPSTLGTFRLGSRDGAPNLYYEVFHAVGSSTGGASYFVCRNELNADIGGFSQASATTVNCNAANVTAPSDYRLKHDITDLEGSLSRVCALRPRSYIWNCSHRCTRGGDGFIAHELAEVIPACVFGEKDAVDADGSPVYQRVDVQKIIVHLVGAIQELTQQLVSLQQRLAALE